MDIVLTQAIGYSYVNVFLFIFNNLNCLDIICFIKCSKKYYYFFKKNNAFLGYILDKYDNFKIEYNNDLKNPFSKLNIMILNLNSIENISKIDF